MSLPSLKRVPRSQAEWDELHFKHYWDHRRINDIIKEKTGSLVLMPPLYPIVGNRYTTQNSYWHNYLHELMNALSHDTQFDFLHTDLSTRDGQETFISDNYKNHYAFHSLVGF